MFQGHDGKFLDFDTFGSKKPSLKLTTKTPENGWLEYDCFFWNGLFSGAMLVSGGVKHVEGRNKKLLKRVFQMNARSVKKQNTWFCGEVKTFDTPQEIVCLPAVNFWRKDGNMLLTSIAVISDPNHLITVTQKKNMSF